MRATSDGVEARSACRSLRRVARKHGVVLRPVCGPIRIGFPCAGGGECERGSAGAERVIGTLSTKAMTLLAKAVAAEQDVEQQDE